MRRQCLGFLYQSKEELEKICNVRMQRNEISVVFITTTVGFSVIYGFIVISLMASQPVKHYGVDATIRDFSVNNGGNYPIHHAPTARFGVLWDGVFALAYAILRYFCDGLGVYVRYPCRVDDDGSAV